MNELKVFNFDELPVRTLEIDNEPYFVGKDVADILGYSNSRKALIDHVDEEDKLTSQIVTAGQRRSQTLINESGLYALIFSSKLDSAKRFKRWVTSEVLPQIRKTGKFEVQNQLPTTYKEALLKLVEQVEENEQLQLENEVQKQQIGELKPKADYVDEILKSYGTVTTTQIAADYGISAQRLNKILHEARLQRRVNKQWILYSEHMNKSYTKSDTIPIVRSDGRDDSVLQTRWTQKGRLKIHEIMTSLGYEAEVNVSDDEDLYESTY